MDAFIRSHEASDVWTEVSIRAVGAPSSRGDLLAAPPGAGDAYPLLSSSFLQPTFSSSPWEAGWVFGQVGVGAWGALALPEPALQFGCN